MNFQPYESEGYDWVEDKLDQYKEEATLFGYKIKYLKAEETESNDLFQESTARSFMEENAFTMYIKKEDNVYTGDEMFGGFGFIPSYQAIYYISVRYFEEFEIEPLEGDIIQDELGTLFEITKVDSKLDTQDNLRINDIILARKVYLKIYSFNYKDSIEDDVLLEELDSEFTNEDLESLNSALDTVVEDSDVVDDTDIDSLFKDW